MALREDRPSGQRDAAVPGGGGVTTGRAASVQARVLTRAKARGEDFSLVLSRYAVERFLYRLSISPARDHYWLKGALLFDLWFDVQTRPTVSADFLCFG